jgi:hypothetical protein
MTDPHDDTVDETVDVPALFRGPILDMVSGKNLLLMGRAGTGASTLVQAHIDHVGSSATLVISDRWLDRFFSTPPPGELSVSGSTALNAQLDKSHGVRLVVFIIHMSSLSNALSTIRGSRAAHPPYQWILSIGSDDAPPDTGLDMGGATTHLFTRLLPPRSDYTAVALRMLEAVSEVVPKARTASDSLGPPPRVPVPASSSSASSSSSSSSAVAKWYMDDPLRDTVARPSKPCPHGALPDSRMYADDVKSSKKTPRHALAVAAKSRDLLERLRHAQSHGWTTVSWSASGGGAAGRTLTPGQASYTAWRVMTPDASFDDFPSHGDFVVPAGQDNVCYEVPDLFWLNRHVCPFYIESSAH